MRQWYCDLRIRLRLPVKVFMNIFILRFSGFTYIFFLYTFKLIKFIVYIEFTITIRIVDMNIQCNTSSFSSIVLVLIPVTTLMVHLLYLRSRYQYFWFGNESVIGMKNSHTGIPKWIQKRYTWKYNSRKFRIWNKTIPTLGTNESQKYIFRRK